MFSKKVLVLTLTLVPAIAYFGFGLRAFCNATAQVSNLPPQDKKISVLVHFMADVGIDLQIEMERLIANQTIAPLLREKGYEIEKVYSMAEIVTQNNGSMERALIKAMDFAPEQDRVRVLHVMVTATPGGAPNTIVSGVALIDQFVSGVKKARELFTPVDSRLLWTYEHQSRPLSFEQSKVSLTEQLTQGLKTYNLQFEDKIKSGQYPDLAASR